MRGPKGREWGRSSCGGDSEPPPHQLGGLGSAVSSSSGVWDEAPENFEFRAFWDLKIASKQCNGARNFMKGSKSRVCLAYPDTHVGMPQHTRQRRLWSRSATVNGCVCVHLYYSSFRDAGGKSVTVGNGKQIDLTIVASHYLRRNISGVTNFVGAKK